MLDPWTIEELTPERRQKYEAFFTENNINSEEDLMAHYRAKGCHINMSCPSHGPVNPTPMGLAKEYFSAMTVWRQIHGGWPQGGGKCDGSSTAAAGRENAKDSPGPGENTDTEPTTDPSQEYQEAAEQQSEQEAQQAEEAAIEEAETNPYGESSESSAAAGGGGASASASPELNLADGDTNTYDAQKHTDDVNASAQSELDSRESVEKDLQAKRDAEAKQSQDEAYKVDSEFITDLKECIGDVMTLASSLPAVKEETPSQVKADNALDKGVDTDAVEKSAENTETEATQESAEKAEAAEAKVKLGGNCGGRNSTSPKAVSKASEKASEKLSEKAAKAAEGKTPDTEETEDEREAREMAEIDTGKDVGLATLEQSIEKTAEKVTKKDKEGTSILDTIKNGAKKIGEIIGVGSGAGDRGAPNKGGTTTETTKESAAEGSILSMVNEYAKTAGNNLASLSKMAKAVNKICPIIPDKFITATKNASQTSKNIAAITKENGGPKKDCRPVVDKNGNDNSAKSSGGILSLVKDMVSDEKKITNLINSAGDIADAARKKKWSAMVAPTTRIMGVNLGVSTKDMRKYADLTKTGIKFARSTMGTSRQNKMTSILRQIERGANTVKSESRRVDYLSTNRNSKVQRPSSEKRTTTNNCNKNNCYGLLSFFI